MRSFTALGIFWYFFLHRLLHPHTLKTYYSLASDEFVDLFRFAMRPDRGRFSCPPKKRQMTYLEGTATKKVTPAWRLASLRNSVKWLIW